MDVTKKRPLDSSCNTTRLDCDLEQLLLQMKPFVSCLSHAEAKNRCNAWIRFLQDMIPFDIDQRQLRNRYAELLFEQLRLLELREPFSKIAPPTTSSDILPPINVSDAFDGSFVEGSELSHGSSSWKRNFSSNDNVVNMSNSSISRPDSTHRFGSTGLGLNFSSPRHTSSYAHVNANTLMPGSDDEIEDGASQWSSPGALDFKRQRHDSRTSLSSQGSNVGRNTLNTLQQREIEMQAHSALQTQFQEELIRVQQIHDRETQRTIERKNNEIEELQADFNAKLAEAEKHCARLERENRQLTMELSETRQHSNQQLDELRNLMSETTQAQHQQMEHALKQMREEFISERKLVEFAHRRSLEEVLTECSEKVDRLQQEYRSQLEIREELCAEAHLRIKDLDGALQAFRQRELANQREAMELTGQCKQLEADLVESRNRLASLEDQYQQCLCDHEAELRAVRNRAESTEAFLRQEKEYQMNKAEEAACELRATVHQMQKALGASEEARAREVREATAESRRQVEARMSDQLREVSAQHDAIQCQLQDRVRQLEGAVEQSQKEVRRLTEELRQNAAATDEAVEEVRRQSKSANDRQLDESSRQLAQTQQELLKSCQLRESQAEQFQRQLAAAEEQARTAQNAVRQRCQDERNALTAQKQQELDSLQSSHASELRTIRDNLREQLRSQAEQDARRIAQLEQTLRVLKEDLSGERLQRKQQLVELGLLRQEEMVTRERQHAEQLARAQKEHEEEKHCLAKQHAEQDAMMFHRTSTQLHELRERDAVAARAAQELKTALEQVQADRARILAQHDAEREQRRRKERARLDALRRQLHSQVEKNRIAEEREAVLRKTCDDRLADKQAEMEQRLLNLLPATLQHEFEETIRALQTQVNMLQQRCTLLQEELDAGTSPTVRQQYKNPVTLRS